MKYLLTKSEEDAIVSFINSYIQTNNDIETYYQVNISFGEIIDYIQCKERICYEQNIYIRDLFINLTKNTINIPNEIYIENYINLREHYSNKKNTIKNTDIAIYGLLTSENNLVFNSNIKKIQAVYKKNVYSIVESVKYMHNIVYDESFGNLIKHKSCLVTIVDNRIITKKKDCKNTNEHWNIALETLKLNSNNIVMVITTDEILDKQFDILWKSEESNIKLYIDSNHNETILEY